MSEAAAQPLTPRGVVGLLLDRDVGPYVTSRAISSVGIWIHNIVAAIVVFQISGSATLVALVSIAQFGPQLALAPWGGMLADRWNRVAQAAIGRLMSTAGAAFLAITAFVNGEDSLQAWQVILGAFVVGVGFATSIPALQALVASLGRPSELTTIVTLDTMPATIARAVGPAIGGVLLVLLGPAWAFAITAASQFVMAVTVWFVRFRPVAQAPAASDQSVLGGFRYLRVDPVVGLMLLGVVGVGLGVDPAITLAPAMASQFGGGAGESAMLTVAFGGGALLTSFLITSLRKRLPILSDGRAGLSILAVSLGMIALGPWLWWVVLWLIVAGFGMFIGTTGYTTAIQRRVPEHLRGRIMALWSIAFLGMRPLSATIDGLSADLFSVQWAFAIMASLIAVAAALGWWKGGEGEVLR